MKRLEQKGGRNGGRDNPSFCMNHRFTSFHCFFYTANFFLHLFVCLGALSLIPTITATAAIISSRPADKNKPLQPKTEFSGMRMRCTEALCVPRACVTCRGRFRLFSWGDASCMLTAGSLLAHQIWRFISSSGSGRRRGGGLRDYIAHTHTHMYWHIFWVACSFGQEDTAHLSGCIWSFSDKNIFLFLWFHLLHLHFSDLKKTWKAK